MTTMAVPLVKQQVYKVGGQTLVTTPIPIGNKTDLSSFSILNGAPGFISQPFVANGASELFMHIWGEAGIAARSALGVAELPLNSPVEVELTVEVA
jgi:hypothetical protein